MAASSSTSLHMMSKLSDFVFSYEPSESRSSAPYGSAATSAAVPAPKLILLASWMDAKDVHIAKYISHYQTIYPDSTILLVKFTMKETLSRRVADAVVQPAVWYILSLIRAGELSVSVAPGAQPQILVHAFSNGGATTIRAMYMSFHRVFGRPFPLHVAVLDSCPGMAKFGSSYNALIAGYPKGLLRYVAAPFIALLVLWSLLWYATLGKFVGQNFLAMNYRLLNDRALVSQTARSYIYGDKDVMVDYSDVERHACTASSRRFKVRMERFGKSPHVAHMRSDGKRYWQIVKETWEKGTSIELDVTKSS
ncbi:hypothetical protein F5Y16DRAFT_377469 [Xylariaceae sp. FL0255]|nr:hypothetical protein F5Y16DRAFT_377469 [Xylariaceae sp. FL0255]